MSDERRVYRVTAVFPTHTLVRHFLTKHRARAAMKRYSEERTDEWWDAYEGLETRTYPAATSVKLDVSDPVTFS